MLHSLPIWDSWTAVGHQGQPTWLDPTSRVKTRSGVEGLERYKLGRFHGEPSLVSFRQDKLEGDSSKQRLRPTPACFCRLPGNRSLRTGPPALLSLPGKRIWSAQIPRSIHATSDHQSEWALSPRPLPAPRWPRRPQSYSRKSPRRRTSSVPRCLSLGPALRRL